MLLYAPHLSLQGPCLKESKNVNGMGFSSVQYVTLSELGCEKSNELISRAHLFCRLAFSIVGMSHFILQRKTSSHQHRETSKHFSLLLHK